MELLRRILAWLLILGGGVVVCSLALALIVDRPEGSAPLPVQAVLVMGFVLGVCPIFLGSVLRRKPRIRSDQPPAPVAMVAAEVTAIPALPPPAMAPAEPDAIGCLVTLTERDLVRFQYWFFARRSWRVVAAITVACAFVGMLALIRAPSSGSQGWNVASAMLTIVLFLAAMAVTPYWSGRRMFRRSPALRQSTRYAFSSSGLHLWTSDSDLTCQWTTVAEAYESRDAVYLQVQERMFRLLPKSAFAAGDLGRLTELLASRLGERWHPLGPAYRR
jgi:hypothetical protein